MKKQLLVIFDADKDLHGLTVVDLEEKLPNGNNKVIKTLFGDYADEVFENLTEDKGTTILHSDYGDFELK